MTRRWLALALTLIGCGRVLILGSDDASCAACLVEPADSGTNDGGSHDGGAAFDGGSDSGTPDASVRDAGHVDAGSRDAGDALDSGAQVDAGTANCGDASCSGDQYCCNPLESLCALIGDPCIQ